MASTGNALGTVVFCLCGPIGSLCCFVLSTWGVIMLFLLGIFYYVEAATLLEDFEDKLNHTDGPIKEIDYFKSSDVTHAYQTAAYSCWGAAVIYFLFLLLSGSFIGVNVWRKKVQKN